MRFMALLWEKVMNDYDICVILEHNIADEALARKGYYEILEQFHSDLSEREIDDIVEIISEEMKHSDLLAKMIYRRTGIVSEH